MKILAIAKPNKLYCWYKNLTYVILEARFIGNRISFWEVWEGRENLLSEDRVKSMFLTGISRKDQPFLKDENQDFYAVLYRHKKEYKPIYESLIGRGKYTRRK